MNKLYQNQQSGTGNVSLTTGDGTLVITLNEPFNTADYNVQLTFAEDIADTTAELWSSTKTKTQFTINVRGGSALDDVDVDWQVTRKTQ